MAAGEFANGVGSDAPNYRVETGTTGTHISMTGDFGSSVRERWYNHLRTWEGNKNEFGGEREIGNLRTQDLPSDGINTGDFWSTPKTFGEAPQLPRESM